MEKNWKADFIERLNAYAQKGIIPEKYKKNLESFFFSYKASLEREGRWREDFFAFFNTLLDLVKEQIISPYPFQPYHQKIRQPFDYYLFGLELLRPLIDEKQSHVFGLDNLHSILEHLKKGENVILLANHQIEADPQAISILLEKIAPELAEEMIFVAGERVVTDPLAAPFSMGRNLLCIFSKRYIDYPPEEKLKKQLHNKKTMELMSALLSEGGKCIYVAPSGGRDRPNAEGVVEVALFDPQSIEMFYLMAKKAEKKTHFYPLALSTYHLLPPPETIQKELGEARFAEGGAIHLAFGKKIAMEHFPGSEVKDKHERRKMRALYIWNLVKEDYARFPLKLSK